MSGPNSRYSRNLFCTAQLDAAGVLFLSERVPFRYVDRPDTIVRRAVAGDTWWSLADLFYGGDVQDAAALLWFCVADFQPVPVVDPTIAIVPGSLLYIPSLRTVETEIFSDNRRPSFRS